MSRFYDYKCKYQDCDNNELHEYYEPTENNNTHKCPTCGREMRKVISMPSINFENARGNGKPENFRSKAERQRRWRSPDPRDKI